MDEAIKMTDNVHVGPFQVEILKGRFAQQVPTQDTHIMVVPIRCMQMWYKGKPIHYPQTTSAACVHHAHSWKQASFNSGAKHDGQCHLSQEGCACGACHISYVGASRGSALGRR